MAVFAQFISQISLLSKMLWPLCLHCFCTFLLWSVLEKSNYSSTAVNQLCVQAEENRNLYFRFIARKSTNPWQGLSFYSSTPLSTCRSWEWLGHSRCGHFPQQSPERCVHSPICEWRQHSICKERAVEISDKFKVCSEVKRTWIFRLYHRQPRSAAGKAKGATPLEKKALVGHNMKWGTQKIHSSAPVKTELKTLQSRWVRSDVLQW